MDNDKREIITHFMDMAGMVTVDRDPGYKTTNNGLFETGFVLTVYDDLGILDTHDADAFYEVVKSVEDSPGVYDRYPAVDGHPRIEDPNSHDDAAGVAAGSKVCKLEFHKDIMEHFAWADNTEGAQTGLWALRLRFIPDVIWYFLLNGRLKFLSPILMLILTAKLIIPSASYGVLIDYMMIHTLSKQSGLWKRFKKFFLKRAKFLDSSIGYFHEDHPVNNLVQKVLSK